MRINKSLASINNFSSKTHNLNNCASPDYNNLDYKNVVNFEELGMYTANINYDSNIQEKLKEIEKQNNVVIIYACEVGSKAWGSDSKNSDNDIRFIYVSPKSKYLNSNNKDTIETELNDKYDIYGYDISKIIKQIKSQDYSPYEWLNSPIKYRTTDISRQLCLLSNAKTDTQNINTSYKRTAISDYHKRLYNKKNINAKSYLFILKNIMMADFIDKKNKLPPLTYTELLDFYKNENFEIAQITQSLIDIKKGNLKKSEIQRIPTLDNFIEEKIKEYSSQDLKKDSISIKDANELNNFFEQVVNSSEFIEINKVQPTQEDIQRFELYPKDNEYRKKILSDMGLNENEYLSLKSIVGPQEFKDIILNFNDIPEIYSNGMDKNSENPQIKNVINGKFRANLHMHTKYSDGKLSVQKLLNDAAKYADKVAKNKNKINVLEPFTIAITDHNTIEGCKEAVEIIRQNPEKYKNLRVILGCELSVSEKSSGNYTPDKPYQIHILTQCINPFDKKMNNELSKRIDKKNPCYASIGTINDVVDILSDQQNIIVGYAHPLKHQSYKKSPSKEDVPMVIKTLIQVFMNAIKDNAVFVENYYQSYSTELENDENIQKIVKEYCDNNGLISTGGLDTHGDSIFFR